MVSVFNRFKEDGRRLNPQMHTDEHRWFEDFALYESDNETLAFQVSGTKID